MRATAVISSIALVVTAAFGAAPAQAASITSTFDTTDEGWTVGDDDSPGGAGAVFSTPTHHLAGGNPGGYIDTTDLFTSNAFFAPSAYLGNQSAYYGGTLAFSLQELVPADIPTAAAVVIYSGASSIKFVASAPGTSWTNFSLTLTEAGWTSYTGGQSPTGGVAISAATFQNFLTNITGLAITADWHNGSDLVGLDSVAMTSAVVAPTPIPATLPLLAAALGGLGLAGWRRKKNAAA